MAVDSLVPTTPSIFGGDTGVTYEELKRRRAVAAALAERQRGYPKNVGEGLTYLGDSIGDILGERRLRGMEAAQRAKEIGVVKGGPQPVYTPPVNQSAPAAATSAVMPTITPASAPPAAVDKGAMSAVGDAIGRHEPDETMRSYYTQLAGREDPTGGQQVSPTGAAGPFQFTRGTGRQYGLYGADGTDNRTDVDASVKAAQQLTRDNARDFIKINGRQPSLSELALMHQQGGVTGARMVAGIGNAPARNLAVNNIDPRLGPQDAAAKVQAYYKMPDATMPEGYHLGGGATGSRDAVAQAMLAQNGDASTAQEVPQENPTDAGLAAPQMETGSTGQDGSEPVRVASLDPSIGMNAVAPREAALNPAIPTDIAPAPKPVPQIAQSRVPGVVPDMPPSNEPIPPASVQQMKDPGAPPVRPPILGPSKAQTYWSQFMNNPNYSPELQAYATRQYQTEEAYRKEIEARQTNDYENQRGQHQTHKDAYDKFVREQPDQIIKQLTDRTNLEKMRADLEEAYFKQGKPREQAIEDARLKIEQAKLNIRKTGQEIAQTETKEIDGVIWQRAKAEPGAPAGPWEVAPGSPKKDKLTETQAKTLKLFQRATVADGQLGEASVLAGLVDSAGGKVPIGGNYWVSPQYQKANAAATAFTLAILRDESGALIGTDEFAVKYKLLFPQPGDSPQTIADKAIRRREEAKSLHAALGDQRGVGDAFLAERATRKADFTDPRIKEGAIRENQKTGKRQRVIGSHWEDIE